MTRPVTMFTGQWADLPLATLAKKAKTWGYDGLELACWGDHFKVPDAAGPDGPAYCRDKWKTLQDNGLVAFAISDHLNGQAVLDPIDKRHQGLLEPAVWGDGKPDGVNQRAAERMKLGAKAARVFYEAAPNAVKEKWPQWPNGKPRIVANGFIGSSIWQYIYSFPPVAPETIEAGFQLAADRLNPILDVFGENGVRFGLEVHPTETAFDYWSFDRLLSMLDGRPEIGSNFDPSHLIWQGVDPVQFIRGFNDRIYHVHMKDGIVTLDGRNGILASHLGFGDPRRGWDFRSLGHGGMKFGDVIRALNDCGYNGPLSVEWEDSGMDREHGAAEACAFVRKVDFAPSRRAFDQSFDKAERKKE